MARVNKGDYLVCDFADGRNFRGEFRVVDWLPVIRDEAFDAIAISIGPAGAMAGEVNQNPITRGDSLPEIV